VIPPVAPIHASCFHCFRRALDVFACPQRATERIVRNYALRGIVFHQTSQPRGASHEYTSKLAAVSRSVGESLGFRDETSVADNHPAIQCQLESRQFAQALPAIDLALGQNPDSFKLWRTKGVALGSLLRHEEALRCFERATDLNPQFFSAWYHRGVACTALELYDEAMLAYGKAHTLNPSDASTSFNLGCVLFHLGRLQEATESLLAAEKAGHPRARDVLNDIQKGPAEAGE
jgi:tetratricopeptide (TPR) repeat protein